MTNQTMTYGTASNLKSNAFSKSGYSFIGWNTDRSATEALYTNGQSVNNLTTTNGGTVNLYAIWRKSVTITYNRNGGAGGPTSQTGYAYNSDTTASITITTSKPTKSGYTFMGWGKSSTTTTVSYNAGSTYSFSGNTTIYAIWRKSFTITYKNNGGTGGPTSQTGYIYNSSSTGSLTLSTSKPTKSGYTFVGWATTATSTSADYNPGGTYSFSGSDTLYAIWRKTITITYNANGGKGGPSSSTGNMYNSATSTSIKISTSQPSKDESLFMGWSTSKTATTVTYKAGSTYSFSSNTTLYAVWGVASITVGSTTNYYSSIASAVSAATSNTARTIVLLVTRTENVSIPSTKRITFNLNSKTLKGTVTNNGTLTLTGGTISIPSTISLSSGVSAIRNLGTMTITSGTYTLETRSTATFLVGNGDGCKMTISGGTFTNNTPGTAIYNTGTLNMTGGTVKAKTSGQGYGIVSANRTKNKAVATIKNVTVSGVTALQSGNLEGSSTQYYGTIEATSCTTTGKQASSGEGSWTKLYYCTIRSATYAPGSGVIARVTKGTTNYTVYIYGPSKSQQVKLPTWTNSGGQDDLLWHMATFTTSSTVATSPGGYWSYNINKSAHNNGTGAYITDVYKEVNGSDVNLLRLNVTL